MASCADTAESGRPVTVTGLHTVPMSDTAPLETTVVLLECRTKPSCAGGSKARSPREEARRRPVRPVWASKHGIVWTAQLGYIENVELRTNFVRANLYRIME